MKPRQGEEQILQEYKLSDFWSMPPARREAVLLEAIAATHARHYRHNRAYRGTVAARGVDADLTGGEQARLENLSGLRDLGRLLRPTAQTFKSYIDVLGTPFPQDRPAEFLAWLDDQLSVDLAPGRRNGFRSHYRSLEALLRDVEGAWADLGFQVLTSSGTSGRSTILVRDGEATERTVESFYLSFCRYLGVEGIQRAIFVMPSRTRIAMAQMAAFSVSRLGLPAERIHFTIPFPAEPDQVRVRAGRTFRPGLAGLVEQRLGYPFMNWMQERVVTPRAVRASVDLLKKSEAAGERVLLFAGWVQLHAIARALRDEGQTLSLAPGSLLGTGGGLKELYPYTPDQIRADVAEIIGTSNGAPVPIRDVYGMAEANWAAMQCADGNYHLPPWVYARTLDEDDGLQEGADTTGLLAFFDPYGGGRLFPAFFKTADQVRLVRPDDSPGLACPCGEPGAYIANGSIRRVDLLDEAGCAAQV
jgi:hypothetical protein